MKETLDFIRGVIRPVVTLGVVAVQSGLSVMWMLGQYDGAKDAFAALMPVTMLVVTFYFKDRSDRRDALHA